MLVISSKFEANISGDAREKRTEYIYILKILYALDSTYTWLLNNNKEIKIITNFIFLLFVFFSYNHVSLVGIDWCTLEISLLFWRYLYLTRIWIRIHESLASFNFFTTIPPAALAKNPKFKIYLRIREEEPEINGGGGGGRDYGGYSPYYNSFV